MQRCAYSRLDRNVNVAEREKKEVFGVVFFLIFKFFTASLYGFFPTKTLFRVLEEERIIRVYQ